MTPVENIPSQIKLAIDGLSLGTVVATIVGWLPNVAALMSIIWLGMQMRDWIKKHRR